MDVARLRALTQFGFRLRWTNIPCRNDISPLKDINTRNICNRRPYSDVVEMDVAHLKVFKNYTNKEKTVTFIVSYCFLIE